MSSDVPPPPSTDPTDPTAPGTTPGGTGSPTPGSPAGTTTTTPPPPPPNGSPRRAMDEFFDRIRSFGVARPSDGRWIGGVASGLSRRWDVDVVLVRGVFIALALMGGVGVAAYGLAWLLLPQEDGRIHLQAAIRGHFSAGFIGAVILSLSAIGGNGPGPWHDGYWFGWSFPGGLLVSLLIVAGIWWYARHERDRNPVPTAATGGAPDPAYGTPVNPAYGTATFTTDPDRDPGAPVIVPSGSAPGPATWQHLRDTRREHREETRQYYDRRAATRASRPVVRTTLGVALLSAAIILFLGSRADWSASYGVIAVATALGVIAIGVIVSGFLGRRSAGLAGLGVILAIATLIGAGAQNAGVESGQNLTPIGQRTWRPATVLAAEKQFNLGIGEATLYLTDPALVAGSGEVDVNVRTGVGHTTIVLPDDVASRVDLRLTIGELTRPDGTTDSVDPNTDNHRQTLTSGPAGAPRLVVNVRHGIGQLDITTASRVAGLPGSTSTPTPSVTSTPTASATTK